MATSQNELDVSDTLDNRHDVNPNEFEEGD